MHGYQLIQAIETRTGGTWKPSPGSIYPTLQLLADEGLVTRRAGRRAQGLLADGGRQGAPPPSSTSAPHPSGVAPRLGRRARAALPKAGAKLAQALGAGRAAAAAREQTERAVAIIDDARRKLYAILAEE